MKIDKVGNQMFSQPIERSKPRMENEKKLVVLSEELAQNNASSENTVQDLPKTKTVNDVKNGESYIELSHKSKQELSAADKDWVNIIERANKAIIGANKTFEYSIHKATNQIMVKVIDKDTNEVIREIPPEKILDMVAKMWEMAGLIVDERR